MKKVTICIFLIVFGKLFAQTSYPQGCYMSLDELISKSPSEHYDLSIEERSSSDIQFNGGNDFKLISEDNSISKRVLKREIWAISDGNTFYINGLLHDSQKWYSKVEDEGKYLIFKGAVPSSEAMAAGLLGGAIGGAMISEKRYIYVMDSKTGETSLVKKKNIHEVLSDYPDILSEYDTEEDKESPDILLKYVKVLNR